MVELLKLLRGYSSFSYHALVAEHLHLVSIMNKVEEYQLLSGSSLRAYPPYRCVLARNITIRPVCTYYHTM